MSIDMIRGVLAGILCVIAYMLWNAWQVEHPAPVSTTAATVSQAAASAQTSVAVSGTLPSKAAASIASSKPITVSTDVLQVKIDPAGGAIIGANLPAYPVSLKDKSPFVLFNTNSDTFYTAQSGLTSPQGPDNQTAAVYQSQQSSYTLPAGQNTLQVPLTWRNAQGVQVTKTFTFTRGSYLVPVSFTVKNQGSQVWKGQFYAQLKHADVSQKSHGLFQINPFVGAVVSAPEKRYQTLKFSDFKKSPFDESTADGWMAMEQHYFISAWVPDAKEAYHYTSQTSDDNKFYAVNMVGPDITVAPGQSQTIQAKLYMGPSVTSILQNIAPGLDRTVDYGFLWFIGNLLFWLLEHIHAVVGNWGWSIILVTVLIKLCFYQLSAKSYRSMAAMRKLQPQLQQLKERYGDDRQKLGQMTMELYKKEKVNPMGGCLPLLVQIPVFIALYGVLLASVQMRLAPWILWIHDLAAPDPYYILPLIMGASMFIQQKMSPPPPDPAQAKMMMAMPVVFTFFFLNFPSGLVLYWVVNNVLSIAQQWFITRRFETKSKKK